MIKNSALSFKIIAGKFKGLRLQIPAISSTRSSKSILRESLFNVLGTQIIGSTFIEGFGGSGSVGLEALSRGAKASYFFEQNFEAFQVLEKNIALLKTKDSTISAQAFFGDVFKLAPQILKKEQDRSKNTNQKILYLDPPFNTQENFADIYSKCEVLAKTIMEKISNLNEFLLIFEHSSKCKMSQNIAHLSIIRQRKFGKSSLSYYALSQP